MADIGDLQSPYRFSKLFFTRKTKRITDCNIEKIALAECIEAVLGKPPVATGTDALPEHRPVVYDFTPPVMMVAEDPVPYGVKKVDKDE